MIKIKGRLRKWLFPEYEKVCSFMLELEQSKLKIKGKSITIKEPIVLIGSLTDCKMNIKPTIKPEIILSKLSIESLLELTGNHAFVGNCLFHSEMPEAKKLK